MDLRGALAATYRDEQILVTMFFTKLENFCNSIAELLQCVEASFKGELTRTARNPFVLLVKNQGNCVNSANARNLKP
jgi:hypothetical protein